MANSTRAKAAVAAAQAADARRAKLIWLAGGLVAGAAILGSLGFAKAADLGGYDGANGYNGQYSGAQPYGYENGYQNERWGGERFHGNGQNNGYAHGYGADKGYHNGYANGYRDNDRLGGGYQHERRYGSADRGGCVASHEVVALLEDDGWIARTRPVRVNEGTWQIEASRDNGKVYLLTVDPCSGDLLTAELVQGAGSDRDRDYAGDAYGRRDYRDRY